MENSSKKFVKDTLLVTISNIISIISGVLIGFVLPKILSVDGYGYYKIYSLYIGYVSILRFGFVEGIYLKFAGKSMNEINKSSMRTWIRFYFILESILTAIGLLIFLFMNIDSRLIFIFVFVYVFSNNTTYLFQMISQAVGRFKELSYANSIRYILNIVLILVLFVIYKKTATELNCYIFLLASSVINFLLLFFYIYKYKELVFGKSSSLKNEKNDIFEIFKLGIPLLIADFSGILITSLDKQIVSMFFQTNEYAYYAFAYNLVNLIVVAVEAISMVLFPTLKQLSLKKVKSEYTTMNSVVQIFMSLSLIMYFPLYYIVGWILPKYNESLPIFAIILPTLLFSSIISIIVKNYYKVLNIVKRFSITSIIVLVFGIGVELLVYYLTHDLKAIAITSVCVYCVWYISLEVQICKKLELKCLNNILYSILSAVLFILIIMFADSMLKAAIIYGAAYILLTMIFEKKSAIVIINKIKHFKEGRQNA